MKSKVSLILTSYNCKNNIERTLKSIENQDYPAVEVIIEDGGSTDGTLDVIKDFAARTKYECKWNSEPDKGIFDAMNKGYEMSSGEIIAFFNDLFLFPDAISKMVEAIEKNHADGAHADLIYATDEQVKRYWKMGEGKIEKGWMPGHPTLYLKRSVYEKYGRYDAEYKCSADYEFMIRILKDGTLRLSYVPVTIVRMYYGGTSTASAGSYMLSLKEAHQALKRNGVRHAWWIDFRRTIKVVLQFFKAKKYRGNIMESNWERQ